MPSLCCIDFLFFLNTLELIRHKSIANLFHQFDAIFSPLFSPQNVANAQLGVKSKQTRIGQTKRTRSAECSFKSLVFPPPPKKKLNSLSGAIHRALFQQILEGSPSSSSSLQANPKSLFSVAKFVKKRNYTNAKSVGLSLRDFLAQK